MNDQNTTTAPVPSGEADNLSRSFLSGPTAIGAHLSEPARFLSHQDEIDILVRNPINQVRLALSSLIITNRTAGSARRLHRDVCGCRHYEDCPTEAARQQRDAEIRARQVEIEIRGYLDMAQGVGR